MPEQVIHLFYTEKEKIAHVLRVLFMGEKPNSDILGDYAEDVLKERCAVILYNKLTGEDKQFIPG